MPEFDRLPDMPRLAALGGTVGVSCVRCSVRRRRVGPRLEFCRVDDCEGTCGKWHKF